jgi:fructokinase
MDQESPILAAIEAGGTKFVVALGTEAGVIVSETVDTTTPQETLSNVMAWLDAASQEHGAFRAIGVGSFGPVDLDPSSPTYGGITTTPKPGWQNVPLVSALEDRFGVSVGFDTDVNAAALGEHLWGAGQGIDPLVYLTVGTGVGGGAIVNGRPLHGLLHPEMGHLLVPPPVNSRALHPECQCPFHQSCLEGFVCGPAIAKRWGVEKAGQLPADSPAWDEVGWILAHGLVNIIVTLSPRRIILGGGVMKAPGVLAAARRYVRELLNDYLRVPTILEEIDSYLVAPGLGDFSGVRGALALADRALSDSPS